MTWEESGLITNDPAIRGVLLECAQRNVRWYQMKAVKEILELDEDGLIKLETKFQNRLTGKT